MSRECVVAARWVFPVEAPPLADGTVAFRDGVVVDVCPAGVRTADVHFGNTAIVPGFVNAHTHLDLTHLAGACPPSTDFVGWLRQVVSHRRLGTDAVVQKAVAEGIRSSLAAGTTLLGDISAGPWSTRLLGTVPLRAVVFHEVLGLSRERAESALERADDFLRSFPRVANLCPGFSPHAPYSVRRELFHAVAAMKRWDGEPLPLAVHTAESPAEMELLARRSGPLVDFLRDMGVWDPTGLVTGLEEVFERISTGGRTLVVHGNYLEIPPGERGWLRSPGRTVVYCPRTHAAFGHPVHPWREMLAAGIEVALGTDSLASNPDLSILEEGRFLHSLAPDWPESILHSMTLAGARALGHEAVCGSIAPGKSADFVVVPLPDREETDPHRLVFDSNTRVQAVFFEGENTFSNVVGP